MPRWLVASVLLLALGACSDAKQPESENAALGEGANSGTSDCAVVVRFEDRIYRDGVGFTDKVGQPIGQAEMSACDDTGANARGPYFPESPGMVDVWSVPGEKAMVTIAIPYSDHSYRLLELSGIE